MSRWAEFSKAWSALLLRGKIPSTEHKHFLDQLSTHKIKITWIGTQRQWSQSPKELPAGCLWLNYPSNCFLAHGGRGWTSSHVHLLLFTLPSVCPNTILRLSLGNFFIVLHFGSFRESTSGGAKGQLSGQRGPRLPIIFALQALLMQSVLCQVLVIITRGFFPHFPRYLLRPKLLKELQLHDTGYYKALSLFRLFHSLTSHTLIITCFAIFPSRQSSIL